MADYVINDVGSTSLSFPSKIKKGDTFRFNITNADSATAYLGYYINYVLPQKCKVKIDAYGARGAYGNLYTYGVTDTTRSGNGAYASGVFNFEEGDSLLMAIGQYGKDAMTTTSSTKDQATGAGGGATTIAKKVVSSSYKFTGTSTNNSNQYSGWYVEPLVIAAGGNGSRDNGYSSPGTPYDGLGYTAGTAQSLAGSTLSGGAFSLEQGTTSSNSSSYTYGRSFLSGNLGSMYYYTRTTYAIAGFGGGGSNADDGDGGGGGGWVAGCKSTAAQSYISADAADIASAAGVNADQGYVIFTFLEVPSGFYVKVNDTWKNVDEKYVKVNGVWRSITSIAPNIMRNWKLEEEDTK
jgi:hypothetical protein